MGCDISILNRHTLDLSSLERLAMDLAERLHINVEYGYYAFAEHNQLLGLDMEEGYVVLGKVRKEGSGWHYQLTDERFQVKALYQKYGEALFEREDYLWYNPSATPEQQREYIFTVAYELTAVIGLESSSSLTIYKEVVSNDWCYYSRWWDFTDEMQGNSHHYDEDYLEKFRKKIMTVTLALGGSKAYYVNDQCTHLKGVGQGDEMEYTWDALEAYLYSCPPLEVLSVSRILTDISYQREVNTKHHRNLAFYDDFADLKV
ncbi:hypothetical protein [Flavobacterium sp. XGLA_31]|uniref:hypothetical protein n=1 Tax=Flavobacterium sp. XGLA_31 TaxID=3447666 RepID=UPI003F3D5B7E